MINGNTGSGFSVTSDSTLYNILKDFIEREGKSCSFDPEVIVVHGE